MIDKLLKVSSLLATVFVALTTIFVVLMLTEPQNAQRDVSNIDSFIDYSGQIVKHNEQDVNTKTDEKTPNAQTPSSLENEKGILSAVKDKPTTTTMPQTPKTDQLSTPSSAPTPSSQSDQTSISTTEPVIDIPETSTPAIPLSTQNERAKASLVNIICTTRTGSIFKPISGSGVIVNKDGLVLVSAHLAQYLLLEKFMGADFIECLIRTGSPAYPRYKAELVYVPPGWINDNKKNLSDPNPIGTGEYDYALIRIDEVIGSSSMPEKFDSAFLDTTFRQPLISEQVLAAGYPAGFLGGISIQTNLYSNSAISTINKLLTYGTTTPDLISMTGSVVAQKGSSGGSVTRISDGALMGIIVTTTLNEQTDERNFRAITIEYINRNIASDLNVSLLDILNDKNLASQVEREFQNKLAPALYKIIVDANSI